MNPLASLATVSELIETCLIKGPHCPLLCAGETVMSNIEPAVQHIKVGMDHGLKAMDVERDHGPGWTWTYN
eukprot:scaffold111739_cov18-Tisochrysis_lutea.AAC.1